MCRRLILIFWLSIIALSVFGQNNRFTIPDYNEIEKLTNDKSSAFYYPTIFERYLKNDTELNLRDYRMLYFGYFFQPHYTPFFESDETDSIKMILGSQNELYKKDWEDIARLGKANLRKNPFDLKGLNVVWLSLKNSGQEEEAAVYFDKLKKLVQIILETGDGKTEETAFHVLNVSHEYDILNILGYEFDGKQELTEKKCDFLSLKTNEDRLPGLYFDVKQIFKGYEATLLKQEFSLQKNENIPIK